MLAQVQMPFAQPMMIHGGVTPCLQAALTDTELALAEARTAASAAAEVAAAAARVGEEGAEGAERARRARRGACG